MIEYLEAKGTSAEDSLDLGIETKSSSPDFCTNIDIKNEKLIIDGIRNKFPKHDIIGEESVGTGTIPKLNINIPTWIIDPIDGTTNFSCGLHSLTCVSIGYCINGQPVLGVIYAPYTNELYVAIHGYGSYRNGKRIYQNPNKSTKALQNAIVCNEMGYTRNEKELNILFNAQKQIMIQGQCKGFRQLGSGCLDLCYVASGRLDVCYAGLCTEGWKPWDYCAGLIIIKEAGCFMESIDIDIDIDIDNDNDNESFDIYGKSVICAVSKELLDELRSVILTSSAPSSSSSSS
jgi:fructose-1,6-bisphosphatase/inositol monophosphatase family enzyme